MKKILGLDLGTTSIGWALVNEKENNEEKSSIIRLGVRVNLLNSGEVNNYNHGDDIATNIVRRTKRSSRHNLQRFKLRRDQLIEYLRSEGLLAEDADLCETGNRTTFNTYRMRAKAAEKEIPLEEFWRVLLMINKKRGYKSNRKIKGDDEGSLVDGMEVAKMLAEKNLTPGQYLYDIRRKSLRFKPEFYRSDLQAELDKIWDKQKEFYPDILTEETKDLITGQGKTKTAKIFNDKYSVETAQNKGKDSDLQALRWRADALNNELPIDVLAYVICDINGKILNSSQRLGMISDRSKTLYFNNQTIGQYLMHRLEENPNNSLTNIIFYRQDYEDEFEKIWTRQAQYHPELTEERKAQIKGFIFFQRNLKSCKSLVSFCELEHSEKEIEVDGKTKKVTIGCKVCPKSSPLFQEFKIWQVINNLAIINKVTDEKTTLNDDEKIKLHNELQIKAKMSKTEVLKLLGLPTRKYDLNYKEVPGNNTIANLYAAYQEIILQTGNGEYDFRKMDAADTYATAKSIFEGLGFNTDILSFDVTKTGRELENEPLYKLWHLLYSYAGDNSKTGNDALIRKLSEFCRMDHEYAKILANVTFEPDYGELSAKAIKKILPFLIEGHVYSDACVLAGYNHSQRSLTKEQKEAKVYVDHIENIKKNTLRNPVVEKILNQMINVINEVAEEYGKPDEIRIEMARELKLNKKQRLQESTRVSQATKETERVRGILQKEFHIAHPSHNDIIRYRLYEELAYNKYNTLYSDTHISKEELFGPRFDIEHIIPKALMFNDSFSNKTLELRSCNIDKGNTTAMDYVSSTYSEDWTEQYKARVNDLADKGAISNTKRKFLLMTREEIPEDFLNRDLTNTQYIARKAYELLEQFVPSIVATNGNITARLREDWQLIDIMKEINFEKYRKLGLTETYTNSEGKTIGTIKDWTKRNDHRHHAMDALTVAFTRPAIIQLLNNLSAQSDTNYILEEIKKRELKGGHFAAPIPLDIFRREAKEALNNILVSVKAKNKVVTKNVNKIKTKNGVIKTTQLTPRKSLHNETVYGTSIQKEMKTVKVDTKLTLEKIQLVSKKAYREALLKRLQEFDGDRKKAFKNLEKNPIWLDEDHRKRVPAEVNIIETKIIHTSNTIVSEKLNVDSVIDPAIRKILKDRIKEYGGDKVTAFKNLSENPIWINKEKGICIKRVKIKISDEVIPLRNKKNHHGKEIHDELGKTIPTDFVKTDGNHHAAIFIDEKGNLQEHIVSHFEVTARAVSGLDIVDKYYNSDKGWKFLFTIKKNEYFVFPNPEIGFDPSEIDLMDEKNYKEISSNLFRAQSVSSKYYVFRQHTDTCSIYPDELRNTTWIRIRSLEGLKGIIKVRVNHIGKIVQVGEY